MVAGWNFGVAVAWHVDVTAGVNGLAFNQQYGLWRRNRTGKGKIDFNSEGCGVDFSDGTGLEGRTPVNDACSRRVQCGARRHPIQPDRDAWANVADPLPARSHWASAASRPS